MNKNIWNKEYKINCTDNNNGHCEALNTSCVYSTCPLLLCIPKTKDVETEFRNYRFRFYHTKDRCMLFPSSIWKLDLYHYEEAHYLVPMLFTGKKDINNKEIYQDDYLLYGDICSDGWMLDKTKVVGMVRYFEDWARFEVQELSKNYRGGHYRTFWDFLVEVEVVGNKFTGIHNDYLHLLDDKIIKREVKKRLPGHEEE